MLQSSKIKHETFIKPAIKSNKIMSLVPFNFMSGTPGDELAWRARGSWHCSGTQPEEWFSELARSMHLYSQ